MFGATLTKQRWGGCLVLLVAMLVFGVRPLPAVRAATITVNSTADSAIPNDGQCTLREAIIAANTNTASGSTAGECAAGVGDDTIDLTGVGGMINLASALPDIGSNMVLNGPGASSLTVRHDVAGAYRIFTVHAGVTATLSGLTISDGYTAFEPGGGIYNAGTLTLNDSAVSNNSNYDQGGGVYNVGTLTLNNCVVSDNRAQSAGGGIYNAGVLALDNSTVSGNDTNTTIAFSHGGGIYNASTGTLALGQSTVANNTITSGAQDNYGGGIYNAGALTLTHSTVYGNQTYSDNGHGGGIYNEGTLAVDNGTVSGNNAGWDMGYGDGGGIYNGGGGSSVTLNNSTVSGNGSNGGGNGGGLWNGESGTLNLKNSIIAGNTASSAGPDCSGTATLTSLDYNLIGNDSACSFTPQANDQVNVDPLLDGLQDNGGPTETRALRLGSPAFDAIPTESCTDHLGVPIATDQRGVARPQGAACDIGAYEAQTAELSLAKTTYDDSPQEGGTVVFTVQVTNDGPLAASGVVIRDKLPIGFTLVVYSANQGTYASGTGMWNLGSLQAGLSATLTLTATVDAGTAGMTLVNTAMIAAADQFDSDAAQDVATATVIVAAPGYVYLPWLGKNYTAPITFPVYIGDAIPARPIIYQGEVFYTTSVQIPDELPPEGSFYFSSQPDALAAALVDDELAVLLNEAEVFAYDFATSGVPVPAIVEVPRTTMEQLAGQTVTIEYRDVYAAIIEASTVWLIWTP